MRLRNQDSPLGAFLESQSENAEGRIRRDFWWLLRRFGECIPAADCARRINKDRRQKAQGRAIPHFQTDSQALVAEKIDCILIGGMAAIAQGAPVTTIDYDLWVRLPERQYVRLLAIAQRLDGTIRAQTVYELSDGTQVNAVFSPDGLRTFDKEWKNCSIGSLEKVSIRVLPLARVIASKRAANREKDIAILPILEHTLRMEKRRNLRKARKRIISKPNQ